MEGREQENRKEKEKKNVAGLAFVSCPAPRGEEESGGTRRLAFVSCPTPVSQPEEDRETGRRSSGTHAHQLKPLGAKAPRTKEKPTEPDLANLVLVALFEHFLVHPRGRGVAVKPDGPRVPAPPRPAARCEVF